LLQQGHFSREKETERLIEKTTFREILLFAEQWCCEEDFGNLRRFENINFQDYFSSFSFMQVSEKDAI